VRRLTCLTYFFITSILGFGQESRDSLYQAYFNARAVGDKAENSFKLVQYYMNVNLDSANFYAQLLLEHSLDIEHDSLVASAYKQLGNIALYQGSLDIALENYFMANAQLAGDQYPLLSQGLMNNIGVIYDRKGDYTKAREYYLKAEQYLIKLKGHIEEDIRLGRESKLYSNIGATYESEEQPDKAMEYYVKGLGLANKIDDKRQQAIVYSNIGSLYLHENKYKLSETNYLEALEIYEAMEDKSGIALMNMHLGDLYTQLNDMEKAKKAYRLSIELGEEVKSATTVFYASKGLHEILANEGDFEEAYNELLRYKILSDSLFSADKAASLARLEMELKFKEEKQDLEDERRIKTIWNYSLGGGIVLILLIFILFYRNLKNHAQLTNLKNSNLELKNKSLALAKRNLEENLDFKNKELTTNVMYLMKKNELINEISGQLLAMRGQFKPENQKQINKIILDLQKAAEEDVWREFEVHFNNVHQDFYDNLLKAYPNLTLNERKLCAFIRLNLTTKEICAITHQSPNTLQVSRTRLRKKLGLAANDQLFQHLNSF
jgi:DNA-binding CsgD family transcriptional regulator